MNIYDFQHQFNLDLPRYGYDASKYLIYLLVKDNKIVYVGKSDFRNVMGRLRSHKKDKDFDSYCVLPFSGNEYQTLYFESGLISLLRPEYNQVGSRVDIGKVKYLLDCMEPVNDPIAPDYSNPDDNNVSNRSRGVLKKITVFGIALFLTANLILGMWAGLFFLNQLPAYTKGEPMPFEIEVLEKYNWVEYYLHYDTCATTTNFITQKNNQ